MLDSWTRIAAASIMGYAGRHMELNAINPPLSTIPRYQIIRQGPGKHLELESRGELGIARYLILFVFVQFLLLI